MISRRITASTQRLRVMIALLLALGTMGSAASERPPSGADLAVIPGGDAALGRLLGMMSTDRASCVERCNRVLLTQIDEEHRWQGHALRESVVRYLETIEELRAVVPAAQELAANAASCEQLAAVARILGYRAEVSGTAVEVERRRGDAAADRRHVAAVLGWDIPELARRLSRGDPIPLTLPMAEVPSPLPFSRWSEICGRRITGTSALYELATDQRVGLLIEGLARVDTETAHFLRDNLLDELYSRAPVAFYRWASAIEIDDGALRCPGPASSAAGWSAIVGAPTHEVERFLLRLLTEEDGRWAALWHSIAFSPSAGGHCASRALSLDDPSSSPRLELAAALTSSPALRLGWPRTTDPGPAPLLRALPESADGCGRGIPGTTGDWSAAIADTAVPSRPAQLERMVSRAQRRHETMGAAATNQPLAALISAPHDDMTLMRRLSRSAGFALDHPRLIRADTLLLLCRMADLHHLSLRALDSISPADPESLRLSLLAVATTADLGFGTEDDNRVESFQGGMELLRILASAGRAPPETLEHALRRWSELHLGDQPPAATALAAWLRDLAEQLPAAPPFGAGRGPLERALLASLCRPIDPQRFAWQGLQYGGVRGADCAAAMLRHLQREGLPAIDTVLELSSGLGTLAAGPAATDLSEGLAHAVQQLAAPPIARMGEEHATPWLEASRTWQEIASVLGNPDNRSSTVERAARRGLQLLETELRLQLVAPAYLEAIALFGEEPLLGPQLIRDHDATRGLQGPATSEIRWAPAVVLPGSASGAAARISGHLGGVAGAMLRFHRLGGDAGAQSGAQDTLRDEMWFENAISSPWHLIDTEVSAVVAAAVRTGEAVVQASCDPDDPAAELLDHLCSAVPRVRRERARGEPASLRRWVSPAELLHIGLAAADHAAQELPAELAAAVIELQRRRETLGPLWRQRLAPVAPPTPSLDGHGVPRLAPWPPYEALENEGPLSMLSERQLVDLRIAVVAYLGRRQLPGEVGGDIMRHMILRASSSLRLDRARDWHSFMEWIANANDSVFDERMRECLTDGKYLAVDL